jgi:AcrR family transcriptional regulator
LSPRRYRSSLRSEQTAAGRRRILDAAGALFSDRGYLGTTIAQIAAAAGVSTQSVYNMAGGKAELLKAVYDVAVAGDDAPVPMAERPAIQAMLAAPDPRQALALYARLGREIAQRTHRLVTVILAQAATGDAALTEFAAQIEAQRAVGTAATARHLASRFGLRPGLTEQAAADILWTLTAPDIVERLITQRNWPWDTYERWLADTMASSLLPPPEVSERETRPGQPS